MPVSSIRSLALEGGRAVGSSAVYCMVRNICCIEAGRPWHVEAAVGEGRQLLSGGADGKSVASPILVGKVFRSLRLSFLMFECPGWSRNVYGWQILRGLRFTG